MSKIFKESNHSITRDLKIDESAKNNYTMSEIPLNSVTKKFLKEPLTLETFDKKFRQMYDDNNKKEPEVEEPPKKKTKRQEGKAIFYDIFIKPKEQKIKEIIDKRNQKTKAAVTTKPIDKNYISNKINSDGKVLGMNSQGQQIQYDFSAFTTNKPIENIQEQKTETDTIKIEKKTKITEKKFKNVEILQKNFNTFFKNEQTIDITLLNKFLHDKYILSKNSLDTTKKNYFNQLIQIRPPEGINAVVASPLMESKGWAPSIPSVNIDKLNTNLKDLMIRAKGGIKNNDIIKEAHMAFYLGIMNEEERKYESALKFYKKYFLSAKLLQDIYGTELALNRIAVLFSNIFDFEQSIYYNEKHKEITTHNLNGFVAYYNCGICYRILENFEKSIENFENALKMSEDENDLESYTLCLAQLAISFIFIGNIEGFIDYSNEFFEKNRDLGHLEMDLEMQILSGYIYNYTGNLDVSKDFYKKSLKNSLNCENERYKAVSLCNIGIIEADKDIDTFLENLGNPESAEKLDLEYHENDELLKEEEQEEDQEQMQQLEKMEQEENDGEQVNENNGEEIEPQAEGEEIQQNGNEEYEGENGQQAEDENEQQEEGENEQQEEGEEMQQNGNKGNEGEVDFEVDLDEDNQGNNEEMEGNEKDVEGQHEAEGEEDGQYQGDADDIENEEEN